MKEIRFTNNLGTESTIKSENISDKDIKQRLNDIVGNDKEIQNKIASNLAQGLELYAVKTTSVIVKETYKVDELKNENNIIESRLLTKNEVQEIISMNPQITSVKDINGHIELNKNSDNKYKKDEYNNLTLMLFVYKKTPTTSRQVQYYVETVANWDFPWYASTKERPAVGDDFIGFYWGGEMACEDMSISGIYNDKKTKISFREVDHNANRGQVWGFKDRKRLNASSQNSIHASGISGDITLYKRRKEKQDTEITVKYVHTYRDTSYSASISSGGVGFTVSPKKSQWPLSVTITGIQY
ncbi:hypothetical protein [Paramaledivibacter caminithermalis]|uniref:Uncharacterized protein n=1 Tax=Paramaledivibacter caminithermalis (strain DSM 15212 / CIP 107654 / DViRD3) TaxID=1121301 RepID=A0A1M6RMD4_PARC5|nr:hypothetical protein [Paramaledivibacter caminithermalis]SHK33589.1 hypothetical protein SAMN02745912_03021 [Paramaledivibacter caminithermalis DSM 15212]